MRRRMSRSRRREGQTAERITAERPDYIVRGDRRSPPASHAVTIAESRALQSDRRRLRGRADEDRARVRCGMGFSTPSFSSELRKSALRRSHCNARGSRRSSGPSAVRVPRCRLWIGPTTDRRRCPASPIAFSASQREACARFRGRTRMPARALQGGCGRVPPNTTEPSFVSSGNNVGRVPITRVKLAPKDYL